MKNRISATVDDETLKAIAKLVKSSKYRNGSHVIETAISFLSKMEAKNGN